MTERAATTRRVTGSVVVCTRDRADHLRRCLDHLERQGVDPELMEIVVVDDGSTDATPAYLGAWAAAHPDRRRALRLERPGLSRARNAGVAAARHDVVLFIDDDARAPWGWVDAHLRCYERSESVEAVGGPVVLGWPDGRPDWAIPRLYHWWSGLDLGDEAQPFPGSHGPYGANMSIRRAVLDAVGGFPASLGRRGRSLVSGEEAAVWELVWKRGGNIRYEPATLVVHEIDRTRLSRWWILRRGLAQGRTNARHAALRRPLRPRELLGACRAEAHFLLDGLTSVAGAAVDDTVHPSEVLDDLTRRSGHLVAMFEHVRLRALDALGMRWR